MRDANLEGYARCKAGKCLQSGIDVEILAWVHNASLDGGATILARYKSKYVVRTRG